MSSVNRVKVRFKKIETFVFLLLIIVLVINLVRLVFSPSLRSRLWETGLPANMKTFLSREQDFSILYPETWAMSEKKVTDSQDSYNITEFLAPGPTFPKVIIAALPVEAGDNEYRIAENRDQKLKQIYSTDVYIPVSISDFQTQKRGGLLREYQLRFDTLLGLKIILCEDYYFKENGQGYSITFCAEDKYWHQLEETYQLMFSSFYTTY